MSHHNLAPGVYTAKAYFARPYRSGDLDTVDLLPDERQLILELGDSFCVELVDTWDARTHCGISYYDNKPFYIGGSFVFPETPDYVEVFIWPDKAALKHPLLLVRSVRKWLRRLDFSRCRALQTHSLPTERHDRFMKALGFSDTGERFFETDTNVSYKVWRRVNGLRWD